MNLDAEIRMNEGCSLRVCVPKAFPDHVQAVTREIVELKTLPEYRNQGFAEKLLQQVCNEADDAGFSLLLHVKAEDNATDSKRLQAFYAKHGFVMFQNKPVLMCRKAQSG